LQALVDGGDANTATITLNYARAIVQQLSLEIALEGRPLAPPARAEPRVWYNEGLKSRDMIVPGLVAVIMMVVAAMLTSLTIAREWERGTMEQLAATPVTRAEVVLGKLLPYVVIGMADVAVSALAGVFLFDVPFRGNAALLAVLSFFFLLGALGMGMFISAIARSQLLATQLAMLATFLPAYLLSGFMFAIQVMPKPLQLITHLIPARYFLVVTRGIFLKGVGVEVLAAQGIAMVVFATAGIALAIRSFRKEIA
jgi:ABC-2 type transport system permease protein